MKLKLVNTIFLSFIFIFGSIFGVKLYLNNAAKAEMDKESDMLISQLESSITRDRINELNKLYLQGIANEKPTTSAPTDGSSAPINFTNFRSMYNYAVKKYNNASYIYSRANGTAILNGNASGIATVNNATMGLTFAKMKKNNEKLFHFNIQGNVLDQFISLGSTHYTDGTTYEYTFPQQGQRALPEISYINTFGWNMSEIFHLPNEESVAKLTDEEIQFYFDTANNVYVGVIELAVGSSYTSNFGSLLYRMGDSGVQPKFNKVNMKIVVDKTGTFKSIEYSEDINITIKIKDGVRLVGNIRLSYIESFDIIDNGFFDIAKPDLSYNNQ